MLLSVNNHYSTPPPPLNQQPIKTQNPNQTLHLFTTPKPLTLSSQHPKPISTTQASKTDPTQTAIQRIADKLRSLGFTEQQKTPETLNPGPENPGEIFIPLPTQLPKYRVGHTLDSSWSTPENPVPRPGSGGSIVRYNEMMGVVEKEKERERGRVREEKKVPTLAELSLKEEELSRLRRLGIAERRKLKVGKAGVTEGIVNGIHERWRRNEVVKIVCEDLCRFNMKRTHELLERKTGGLVVWRAGSKLVLYRGVNYKYPYFIAENNSSNEASSRIEQIPDSDKPSAPGPANNTVRTSLVQGVGLPDRVRFQLPGEAQLAEEADCLLDGLGPRFTDWWGYDPVPVDADLLPAVVRGFRRPFRLLPYGVKPILTNDEMNTLRRLGKPLPCHFALGRNRKHQGLAAAIIKLWEKCEIAKIAVKRGVQNTNSELMSEELKWLTGGTLLLRDREFIVLYRGKDFLPSAVSNAIEERRNHAIRGNKRQIAPKEAIETAEEAKSRTVSKDELDGANGRRVTITEHGKLKLTETAIQRTSSKLSMALEKKAKAEKLLEELEKSTISQPPEADKEGITEEERYMLRKVGLKMKKFLLMGRRGVFDGTIENMHLHWKYREIVKIICKENNIEDVYEAARTLEAESGGILVAVERVSKGYAIVVYRGKNYRRPDRLRPPTLLSKKEAMKRSLEAQRHKSLKLHVLKLAKNIKDLEDQLVKDKEVHNTQQFKSSELETEEEVNSVETEELERSETETKSNIWGHSAIPVSREENLQSIDMLGVDHNVVILSDDLDASQPVENNGLLSNSGRAHLFYPDNFTEEESSSCDVNSTGYIPIEETGHLSVQEENKIPPRGIHLSNKERLLLRRQALKTKKRPVIAVGRSNIVTGVAKTIKNHFKRHPLAIVNVKGRAKGTSIQEVVFQLEQATGAVLVSQEPSKVILYRGWGADEGLGQPGKRNARDARKNQFPPVSPELMAAIRVECGMQHDHGKERPDLSAGAGA